MMHWFTTGLLRLLAGEPWTERRKGDQRSALDRRRSPEGVAPVESDRRDSRREDRRREDRRGRGWLRFWNPP